MVFSVAARAEKVRACVGASDIRFSGQLYGGYGGQFSTAAYLKTVAKFWRLGRRLKCSHEALCGLKILVQAELFLECGK